MSILTNIESRYLLSFGDITGYKVVRKSGSNGNVGNSDLTDIWQPNIVFDWQQSAVAMEILSDSANDAAAGTGARTIFIDGLDATFEEQSEVVTLNGLTPVTLANTYIRINNMTVASSGTYGDTNTGSNFGVIDVRVVTGAVLQSRITTQTFGVGFGAQDSTHYTVPLGKEALLVHGFINVDSSTAASIVPLARPNADTISAPFSPKISKSGSLGKAIIGQHEFTQQLTNPLDEKTDLWFAAISQGSPASVAFGYELLVRDKL